MALRGLLGVGTEGARAEIPRAFPQGIGSPIMGAIGAIRSFLGTLDT